MCRYSWPPVWEQREEEREEKKTLKGKEDLGEAGNNECV